jgi:D-amino peptidase
MEGIAGLAEFKHARPPASEFRWMVKLWIDQINIIVKTALSAGIDEVLVNEAHSGMNYLNLAELHPNAGLVSGYLKADNQMHGLDESFLGAVFIGHARVGTPQAVLNHTYLTRDIYDLRLNGQSIGELGLNGYWAAYLGSGLIMVVGDDKTAEEARNFNDSITGAVLKEGISQFSARHLSYSQVITELEEKTKSAISKRKNGSFKNVELPEKLAMEIDFAITEMAHLCSYVPGVERIAPRTIRFESEDFRNLQHTRIVCTNLALASRKSHF